MPVLYLFRQAAHRDLPCGAETSFLSRRAFQLAPRAPPIFTLSVSTGRWISIEMTADVRNGVITAVGYADLQQAFPVIDS